MSTDVLASGALPTDELQTQADNEGLPMPSFLDSTPNVNDSWLTHTMKTLPSVVGFAPSGGGTGVGGRIIAAAEKYLGTPYGWGNVGGVDCSGLVQLAYKAAGIDLPRISYQQANTGSRVALNRLRPGDLVAWDNSTRNPGADHIAIYLGNGQIIEAPRPGEYVRIRKLGRNESAWGVRMGW